MSRPRVAFVCVHNSCRSQIAETLGRALASDAFESFSAGSEPAERVNPDAVRIMRERYGIDMEASQRPKTIADIPTPDVAISMGCGVTCPFVGRPFDEDWGLPDPTGGPDEDFVATIEAIRKRVLELRERLMTERCASGPMAVPMEPIAHIRTDLPQKFGIPRNSFLAPHLQGRIVFEPAYASEAAVLGLERFSHLWLIWQFENGVPGGTAADVATDAATARRVAAPAKWSRTVRPPRLGGGERVGVFATRSPFRPNGLGLTCVRLDRVELTEAGPIIHVLGADLRDRTPIFDIKPYIPFADCHPDATGGWIDENPWHELAVDFPAELQTLVPVEKLAGLVEVLRQDPRRAGSKREPARVYHLAYAGLDVSFTVDGDDLHVIGIADGLGQ